MKLHTGTIFHFICIIIYFDRCVMYSFHESVTMNIFMHFLFVCLELFLRIITGGKEGSCFLSLLPTITTV